MRLMLGVIVLTLSGCATVEPPPQVPQKIYLQTGEQGYEISCNEFTDSCARQSAAICATQGYNVRDVHVGDNLNGNVKEDISCGYQAPTPEQRAAALKELQILDGARPVTCNASTTGNNTTATCSP